MKQATIRLFGNVSDCPFLGAGCQVGNLPQETETLPIIPLWTAGLLFMLQTMDCPVTQDAGKEWLAITGDQTHANRMDARQK